MPSSKFNVAVVGNPNTGKSTIFTALSGVRQKTGNYSGVTVEKKSGLLQVDGDSFELSDLPGTYSLAPNSPEEMVSVNVLLGNEPFRSPDAILCVVDASNLERNLFLVSQLLELEIPMVVALNMFDISNRRQQVIDVEQLEALLGCRVIPTQAKSGQGIAELKKAIQETCQTKTRPSSHQPFSGDIATTIEELATAGVASRFALTRILLDTDGFFFNQVRESFDQESLARLINARERLKSTTDFAQAESKARYDWIGKELPNIVSNQAQNRKPITHRVDKVLMHPVWGMLIAVVVLGCVFQIVFYAAEPASAMIDWLTGLAKMAVDSIFVATTGNASGALHSLISNGLIDGVGGVLVFLPQIVLLFLILALLEDSGYLARLAYLTDRYLSKIGLSGITVIPLLSSFACAIPGIMGTRVIKNERERLITILIAPLMSCSARLPVYTLLIAAFVPGDRILGIFGWQGLVMLMMYFVGVFVAIVVAWTLKKTLLRTGSSTFVMELPTYQLPDAKTVFQKVFQGAWEFVKGAGTIIVAATIVVWAAAYFPHSESRLPDGLLNQKLTLEQQLSDSSAPADKLQEVEEKLATVENQIAFEYLQDSYLARTGKLIEPVVRPLGWDWRIGSAAIASFPAREVIVSTLGVLFGLGDEVDEGSDSLKGSLQRATWTNSDEKLFTLPVALSIMVFFALCSQCSSTLAVIKRETNSWRWPIFTFVYMTVLAYGFAFVVYQLSAMIFN